MSWIKSTRWSLLCAMGLFGPMVGCGTVTVGGGSGMEVPDDEIPEDAPFELVLFASNTNAATGIALNSSGELFVVNQDGLFGPVSEGADLSTMEPIGATNLADEELFDMAQTSLVLAISPDDEFWIGTGAQSTLAIVPPEGGDAVPFTGLIDQNAPDPSNINPETMIFVPDGFSGAQIMPGDLLVGQDTDFSELSSIDVTADPPMVTNVDNPLFDEDDRDAPGTINRHGQHLTFDPNGNLFAGTGTALTDQAGIQMIEPDGTPVPLEGTEGINTESFVVLDNGDLIIRGTFGTGSERINGILVKVADVDIELAIDLPDNEVSDDDELILSADGNTIFLALPRRNGGEIYRVIDNR